MVGVISRLGERVMRAIVRRCLRVVGRVSGGSSLRFGLGLRGANPDGAET